MEVYVSVRCSRNYFLGVLMFTLISFAYVDKIMNYSGAYTSLSTKSQTFDYSVYEIEFEQNSSALKSSDTMESAGVVESTSENVTVSSKQSVFSKLYYGHSESAVFINSTVCVEGAGQQRRIVVYGAEKSGTRKLLKFYQIEMRNKPLPLDVVVRNDSMAVFLTTRWVSIVKKNMFHFFNDFFVTYTSILQQAKRLGNESHNYVLMHQPFAVSGRLRFFLDSTNTKLEDQFKDLDFNQIPEHTCFEKAAFADAKHPPEQKKKNIRYSQVQFLVSHILDQYNTTNKTCPKSSQSTITILQRDDYRKIQNLAEITETLRENFHGRVRVVNLNNLTFVDKLRIVFCTDILIGVQGAGLTWTLFLRPGASLIEIAWPAEGWPFYFSTSAFQSRWFQQVNVHQIASKKVVLPSRSTRFWLMKKTKKKLSKKNRRKFANVFVSSSELLQTVQKAARRKLKG